MEMTQLGHRRTQCGTRQQCGINETYVRLRTRRPQLSGQESKTREEEDFQISSSSHRAETTRGRAPRESCLSTTELGEQAARYLPGPLRVPVFVTSAEGSPAQDSG